MATSLGINAVVVTRAICIIDLTCLTYFDKKEHSCYNMCLNRRNTQRRFDDMASKRRRNNVIMMALKRRYNNDLAATSKRRYNDDVAATRNDVNTTLYIYWKVYIYQH